MTESSAIETYSAPTPTPAASARAAAQVKDGDPSQYKRPGEGDPTDPGGPVNWHGMLEPDLSETFDALTDFLIWAIPHWGFTTEQFPCHCWWLHADITEQMTAWWGMWQAYIRNPASHIADPMAFHERTHTMQKHLADTYRGRCRQGHQPMPPLPAVAIPVPGIALQ